MGKVKSNFGCIASLFTCFRYKHQTKEKKNPHRDNNDVPDSPLTTEEHPDLDDDSGTADEKDTNGRVDNIATDHRDDNLVSNGHNSSSNYSGRTFDRLRGKKRVNIQNKKNGKSTPQSPRSDSMRSMSSAVSRQSSVYFDASDECDEDYTDDAAYIDEDTLQIDGQYFFSAMDDPNLSQEAFDGIRLYPPLPTTSLDPLPRSPISITNIQSLLYDYQHKADDASTKLMNEKADLATSHAGVALELQAKRLLSLKEDAPIECMDECTNLLLKELKVSNVREKGFPGELSSMELEAVKKFQYELQTRSDRIYYEIVHSFRLVETEAYALCRFLRARQFDVEKVFELLDVAKEYFAVAYASNFYPDLEKDMGVSRSVFLSQYPAVFCGNAKNGCPVMYLKAGSIQPEGIKCVVSFDKVDRFFWNDLMYTFTSVLKEGGRRNPQFVRTENIAVYDLKGVSRSQITSDTFEMIKVGNKVMTSFPETLHCLLIINAPTWFGVVWSVAKKLIDPRTASKIEVFTSAKTGLKRMTELIDESEISSDCGGKGPSLAEAASSEAGSKMVVLNKLLTLTKKMSDNYFTFEFTEAMQGKITLTIYTRCKAGAIVGLFRIGTTGKESLVAEIDVFGEREDVPYSRTIAEIDGPGNFVVKLKGKSQPGVFLLIGTASPDDKRTSNT